MLIRTLFKRLENSCENYKEKSKLYYDYSQIHEQLFGENYEKEWNYQIRDIKKLITAIRPCESCNHSACKTARKMIEKYKIQGERYRLHHFIYK